MRRPRPSLFDMSHQHQPTDSTSNGDEAHDSLLRRSWHAMSDLFQPFSSSALDKLPKSRRPQRYTRVDEIPDVDTTDGDGQMPTVRDYHSITVPPQVRVPKKIPTPVRVESKVWFANERSKCLDLPTNLFFFCPYVSPLRLSAVVCRCRIFACSNIRIVGWLRSDSICSPCGPSMGLVPQHVYLDRHACSGAVQRFQRSHRAQLCICVCSHQHRNPCTYSLRPHSSVIPSLFEISFPSLPFTSIFLLLREAVSLMLSLYADLRLGCIPATCHQDPQA